VSAEDYTQITKLIKNCSKYHKEIWLSLYPISKERSSNQNRYYWGVVIHIIANELGYLPEELHDTLKAKFLIDQSSKLKIVRSTSNLDTVQFENYLSLIRVFASTDLNIFIPLPNEVPFEF
jgi:hypothetical protein